MSVTPNSSETPAVASGRTPTTATPVATIVMVRRVSDLGFAITKRRKEMGLTLNEAAAFCGVGTRFLFDLEHGKESIEFGRTIKVANRFGIRLFFEQRSMETHDGR